MANKRDVEMINKEMLRWANKENVEMLHPQTRFFTFSGFFSEAFLWRQDRMLGRAFRPGMDASVPVCTAKKCALRGSKFTTAIWRFSSCIAPCFLFRVRRVEKKKEKSSECYI